MVLTQKGISSTRAVYAVSLALRSPDDEIPHDLLQAAQEIFECSDTGKENTLPDWVREDFQG
jgi:hypothetical protein